MSRDSKKSIETFSVESFVGCRDDIIGASVATAWALCLRSFSTDREISFGYHGGQLNLSLEGKTVQAVIKEILDFGGLASSDSMEGDSEVSGPRKDQAFSSTVYSTTDGIQSDGDVGDKAADIAIIFCSRSNGVVDVQVTLSTALASEVILWAPHRLKAAMESIGSCFDGEALLSVNLLSAAEEKALEKLGQNGGQYSSQHSLTHQLFENQVLATPQNPAVQFEDEEPVSYEALNSMANRVARHILQTLSKDNKKDNSMICLCLEKGVPMVVAILAVLKAGKAWVPLDPKNPRNRLDKILQATQAPLIIVTRSTTHIVSGSPVLVLEDIDEELQQLSPANLNLPTGENDLCHVLFTSGSTGVPKGVMIEHVAMVNTVCWLADYCEINECTRALQFAAYTFDVCGLDIFMTLARGGCLFMAPTVKLLANLNDFVEFWKINYTQLTPTVINLLVPSAVPSLKTIVSSGEDLPENIILTWLGRTRLINAYGPTETNLCTLHDVSSHPVANCIGGPDCGMSVLIVDEYGRKAPIGVIGEICVAGPQLFRGYLGDPELTLKKRTTHAIGPLYKTGDLGNFDCDGRIYFHGRQDSQVKLLGNRVDLAEIEACIAACRSARHSVVTVPRAGPAKGRLAAVLCLTQFPVAFCGEEIHCSGVELITGVAQALSDIKDRLLLELPAHMIPSVWFTLAIMPLTTSGKVNRIATRGWLEEMDEEQYQKQLQVVGEGNFTDETLTPEERKMREIWSRLLSLPPNLISADSSFFEIGGDSISVIRMVSEARGAGFAISVQDVFTLKTNRRLSLITKEKNLTGGSISNGLPLSTSCVFPGERSLEVIKNLVATECNVDLQAVIDVYPCSPLQEGLMASSIQSGAYISRMVFRLPGVDLRRFKNAWKAIFRSEEILRTRIIQIAPHGTLQAIIDSSVEWESAGSSVEKYLESTKSGGRMGYGDKLCRVALVFDNDCWHFVLTIHHALFDGWSLSVLKERLRMAYKLGVPPHQRRPFKDFIKHLVRDEPAGMEEFWTSVLEGVSITDYPNLPVSQYEVKATKSSSIFAAIDFQHVLKSQKITISTVIRAAWAIVLAQHSNSGDICFGVTMSGRNVPLEGVEEIAGPTLVTVPIRIRVRNTCTLGDLLHHTQEQAIKMIPFEHTGLQNIRKISVSAKNACSFRTLLIIQPGEESLETEFLQDLNYLGGMQRTYPLTIECQLEKGGITLHAYYDEVIINQRDVDWILVHLRETLHSIASNDGLIAVCDVGVLGNEDVQQIYAWNKNCPQKVRSCLHHLFGQKAIENPLGIAIYDQTSATEMSYVELDSMSTHLANKLQGLKVVPETLVPICFEKSSIAIVAIIAVLKAGGAYVPLDTSYPDSRLESIIKEVGAGFVFCSSSCAQRLRGIVAQVVVVDSLLVDYNAPPAHRLVHEVQPDNAAFVTYTSGSTGVPKAVVLTHSAISTSATHLGEFYGIREDMRVLQFNSFTFDMSLKEIFITLLHGGCICIPTEHKSLNNLSQAAGEMVVNVAFLTPTVARLVRPQECLSLKILCTGGEMLTRDVISIWADRVAIFNSYGPTETCMNVSATKTPLVRTSDPENIGHGVTGNVWIITFGEPRRLAPIGCPGEIVISGHTLARGYHGDVEKTRAAFINTPKSVVEVLGEGEIPKRCYLTGDAGCYNYDGSIQYLGRLDRQIKLNGLRIGLGEIEYQLRAQENPVRQIVAELVTIEQQGEPSLVVFVECGSANHGSKQTPLIIPPTDQFNMFVEDARNHLRSVLPRHMIPDIFIPVSRIPIKTSGKVDRRRLIQAATNLTRKEVDVSNHPVARTPSASLPLSEAENLICDLWKSVLSVDQEFTFSVYDNFFHLGGDSIAVIKLVAAARSSGLCLSASQIYEKPQLAEMASCSKCSTGAEIRGIAPFALAERVEVSEIADLCRIPLEHVEDVYPCTPLQEGLMAISTRTGAYVAQRVYTISNFSASRFHTVWEDFVRSSSVLRTRIVYMAGKSFQVVCKESPRDLWRTGSNLEKYLQRDRQDLVTLGGRLCRFALVQEGDTSYFVLTLHHALYDGWSMELLMGDLRSRYIDLGSQSAPSPGFNLFVDFLGKLDCKSSTEYWAQSLEGSVASDFPPKANSTSLIYATSVEEIGAVIEHRALLGSGVTFATVVRAAWAFVLSRYLGSSDICFGMTLSGRDTSIPGIERIVGPTSVTVPVRVKINEQENVGHFLQRIQQEAVDMTPFQHTGLQNIQRINTDTKNACSFRNILVIQADISSSSTSGDFPELSIIPAKTMTNMLQSYFTVECQLTADGVLITASYDSSTIGRVQVQRLLRHFVNVIRQIISLSSGPHTLANITTITEEDFEEIQGWNSHCPTLVENCVHHIFEAEAKLYPDSMAIDTTRGEKLTYGQLEDYATRLAHHIASIGIERGCLVPICFQKSVTMVVAMLAVMKAGAGYVPIDPLAPRKRVEHVLIETKAKMMLVGHTSGNSFDGLVTTVLIDMKHLNQLSPVLAEEPSIPAGQASDVAYTIFTSGSTGKPKGVVLEHGPLCTSLLDQGKAFGYGRDSRVLQFCSYTFDISVVEIFGTLLYGGCICMPSENERLVELAMAIKIMAADTAFLTPTVTNLLEPNETPLKTLVLVGEPHSRAHIDKWASGLRLINAYGPTEAAITSSSNYITAESIPNNIGRAVGGLLWVTEIHNNKLAAIGTVGELVISGNSLARGYLNDTKQTELVFLKHLPLMLWDDKSGSPRAMYKTGDLARYNLDGSIQYLGRKDTQVKIHGQRIECGEIECSIIALGQVDQAAVELVEISGIATLVAFICISPMVSLGISDESGRILPSGPVASLSLHFQRLLEDVLPFYMIPSIFVPYVRFPTTISGKVDRKQLRSIELVPYTNFKDVPMRQAATPNELLMQEIWSSTLDIRVGSIGLDDSFFRLGGDSISAITVVTSARKLGFSLDIPQLFSHPKLGEMASLLTTAGTEQLVEPFSLVQGMTPDECINIAAVQCGLENLDIDDVYPCSPLQAGLMALSIRSPGAYVTQRVYQLPTNIDIKRFQEAWEITVVANPILRTRIIDIETYGSAQVVTNVHAEWNQYTLDLQTFLSLDHPALGYGTPLCHQAIVFDNEAILLVLTLHHAIYDGFSWDLMLDDLEEAYEISSVTTSRTSFATFIKHVENVRTDPAAEVFWRNNLAQAKATNFPDKRILGNFQDVFRARKTLHHPEVKFSWSPESVTIATLLRASWAFLISRYINSDDVTFGETFSGRTAPVRGIETVTGPTIVTVPTRVCIEDDQTVNEYLSNVHTNSIGMLQFQHLGLQNIRRISDDTQEACNFQSLLVIQPPKKISTRSNKGLRLELDLGNSSMVETYCLSVECQQTIGGVSLSAVYDDCAIDSEKVRWILYHFSQSIKQLAAGYHGNQKRVGEICFFGEQDLHQIKIFNSIYPDSIDRCLHHAFSDCALLNPHRVAIHASDAIQTYEELDTLSSSLASELMVAGVGPGALVPLFFRKSSMMIVAMIAVLKAGGGYVPLDTSHPKRRLQYIINEIDAKILLCSYGYEAVCSSLGPLTVLALDPQSLSSNPAPRGIPNTTVRPSDVAYVMFTSGTTGQPKGVVLEHSAVTTSLMAHGPRHGFKEGLRVLQFGAYTFDVSVMEIFSTLLFGGCLCIPSEEERLVALPQIINEMQVELAILTPTTVASLLSPELVPMLSTLVLIGEPMTQQNVVTWSQKVRLINDYGPTETCTDSAAARVTGPDFPSSNIGTGVAANLWIVEPERPDRLAPVGCVGELLISGPTLARGYFNDYEKTNAAFIDGKGLPWGKDALGIWSRLYKTGDLAQYNIDGSISYLGRKDTQVKLRGLRVEVSEVEHHISLCPGIQNVAVEAIVSPEHFEDVRLIAFVCLDDDAPLQQGSLVLKLDNRTNDILRQAATRLSDVLPSYMIPSIFLPLKRVPLNTSGKRDRKELRKILSDLTVQELSQYRCGEEDKRAPATVMERRIQALWSTVLQLAPASIGLDDNFFRLGGDSMTAIRLATMGRREGLNLTVSLVFKSPRLGKMANGLEGGKGVDVESPFVSVTGFLDGATRELAAGICGITPADIEDVYPCSPLQEGLMALSTRFSGVYVARRVYELAPGVNLERFCSAWKRTVESHDTLRTRIMQTDENEPRSLQVVCRESPESNISIHTSLKEYLKLDYRELFGYGRPLIRCGLISGGNIGGASNNVVYFAITLHHALYDGFSFRLILDDFQSIYTNPDAPHPTRTPFKNYIGYLETLDQEDSQDFWKSRLAGLVMSDFPPSPPTQFAPQAPSSCYLNLDLLMTKSHITFPTIIRAAWAITVSRHTLSPISEPHDVCFGSTLSGRTVPVAGLDSMAGPTIVTLPVRVTIDYNQPITEYLDTVHSQAADMMPFEYFGLQNIRRLSPDARRACEFNNLLVIHPPIVQDSDLVVVTCMNELEDYTEMLQIYGIVMECQVTEGGVSLHAQFHPLVIDHQQILWVLQYFANIIKELSQNPSSKRPLRDTLSGMASNSEYEQVLRWNSGYQASEDQCLYQLVENTTSLYPNRLAVFSFDNQLTYQELDFQAGALAQHLIDKGIGPEVLVPICFEKSSVMVVAILGILKAGGGYVPLDPAHPKARLEYIIRETEARLILSSPSQRHIFDGLSDVTTLVIDPHFFERQTSRDLNKVIPQTKPNNVAYVIYTSGSTGDPKGVIIENGAISKSVIQHGIKFGHNSIDGVRVLQFCSYTFDVSVIDIFTTLAYGGCICVPSENDRLYRLPQTINEMKIDLVILTPTVAKLLDPAEIPGLKVLAMTGEILSAELVRTWNNKGRRLVNGYGPTEASVDCTAALVSKDTLPNNIGHNLGGLVWITEVDDHNKLAPLGCAGEIVISGDILARGYLKDPGRTTAAFVNNPSWIPQGYGPPRIYKTGDLGRYAGDGSIEYLGRKDTQVKLHGMRIETGEVESHLGTCNTVLQSAVELVTRNGIDMLVGFLRLTTSATNSHLDLTGYLLPLDRDISGILDKVEKRIKMVLPPYMVPSVLVPLSVMPYTTSGKTDHRKLKEIFRGLSQKALSDYRKPHEDTVKWEPGTITQRLVRNLWADTLRVDPCTVGLDDDFFRLGGDSISAIQLVSAFRRNGLTVAITDIHQSKNLEDMAARLDLSNTSSSFLKNEVPAFSLVKGESLASIETLIQEVSSECCVEPGSVQDIYPCSPLQEGLIALSTRETGAYLSQRVYRLPSTTNLGRFRTAWEGVLACNEILRSRIVHIPTIGSLQVVLEPHIDWKTGDNIQRYLEEERSQSLGYGDSLCRYGIFTEDTKVYFVLSIHHALYDGWSLPLIMEDLRTLYETQTPPPFHVPYNRFIQFIVQSRSKSEAAEIFWQTRLAGATVTDFPEKLLSHKLNANAVDRTHITLQQKPLPEKVTTASLIKAAWAIILARYMSSNDVCFGMALTGRNSSVPGIESITGPTQTAVPVRITVDPNESVNSFLKNVHSQSVDMIPYEHIGLQNIQSFMGSTKCCEFRNFLVIQPSRRYQKPFGAKNEVQKESPPMIVTQNDIQDHLQLEEIQDAPFKQQYALVIECELNPDQGIGLTAYFDPVVIDKLRVGWLLRHLSSAIQQLESLCAIQGSTIDEIDIVTQYEKDIMWSWNKECPDVSNICVHQIFENQARKTPRLEAIRAPDKNLDYGELDQLSSDLASYILSMNVQPDTIIPVCIEKSSTMVVSLLAIFKAGAAYVPIDTSYPSSRIRYIFQEVKANIVLASEATANLFNGTADIIIVSVDKVLPEIQRYNSQHRPPVLPTVSPSGISYVIFTSGSTGNPKGVVVEHSALSTTVISQGKIFGFTQGMQVLQYSSLAFDPSISQIFTTLAHGGCLCIPSENDRLNRLEEIMNELQVEMADLTPTILSLLNLKQIPSLKTLILGGEPITQENINDATDARIRLFNAYGPTEACIDVINAAVTKDTKPNNIGRPTTCRAWILELGNSDRLAPLGCVGELVISGPTLARGYLNDKEKTKDAFIETPPWMFRERSRVYKTGDLARFNCDGSIQYLGRRDTQVKVHGQRIELGEIEHKICGLRPDLQAVVDFLPEGKRSILVAFIFDTSSSGSTSELLVTVPTKKFTQLSREILARLKDLLPAYMIPSLFIPISYLPMGLSTKLDRKQLQEAFSCLSQDQIRKHHFQSEKSSPTTKTEEILQSLWAKVLGFCDPSVIGLDDEFFDLGGDSIIAIQLVAAARDEGFLLTVSEIFSSPKLRQMCAILQQREQGPYIKSVDSEVPRPFSLHNIKNPESRLHKMIETSAETTTIQDIYPATALQLACLIEGQKWHKAYYVWFMMEINGQLDVERLRHACQLVVDHHPILRTVFHMDGGRGLQIVLQETEVDFRALHDQCDLNSILQMCQDVGPEGPVAFGKAIARFRVLSLGQNTHRLALGLSHAQYDGMCLDLILDDIRTAYSHKPLPTRPNYSIFISYALRTNNEESELYWRTMLNGSTMTNLVSRSLPSERHLLQNREERQIPNPSSNLPGATFSTVIRAAWSLVLAQLSGNADIVFGGLISGRNAPIEGIEQIIGPCMNILPIRVCLEKNWTYNHLLDHLRTQQSAMIPYETMSFTDIVEKCTEWPRSTRFGSVVQHQNLPMVAERNRRVGDLEWNITGTISYPGFCDEVDCWVSSEPDGDHITIGLRYNDWVLPSSVARKMLDSLCTTVMDIFESPDRNITLATSATSQPLLPIPANIAIAPISPSEDTELNFQVLSSLRNLWQEIILRDVPVAQRKSVTHNVDVNFFEIGGDSIAAAQLAASCAEQQLNITIQDIFDYPTLRSQTLLASGAIERFRPTEREGHNIMFWEN